MPEQPTYWTTYSAVLGSVLARVRSELGFDQRSMAAKLSISQATWSRIERGESPITAAQLFDVGRYLRVQPHTLMKEADTIVANLERSGVIIHHQKPKEPSGVGLALAGAGALALAMALLSKGEEDED